MTLEDYEERLADDQAEIARLREEIKEGKERIRKMEFKLVLGLDALDRLASAFRCSPEERKIRLQALQFEMNDKITEVKL